MLVRRVTNPKNTKNILKKYLSMKLKLLSIFIILNPINSKFDSSFKNILF